MKVEDLPEFNKWYIERADITDWNFKDEMIKYSRADDEVVSRDVLVFRQMFYDNLNIDPFRYITLPILCMNIYKVRVLPDKSTVANDANKPISKVSREWFINLDNTDIHREKPLVIEQTSVDKFDKHQHKIIRYERDEPVEFDDFVKDSCRLRPDGLDGLNETVYEFYGCKFHGCQKCYKERQQLYNTTMERENILKTAGYKVEAIWECEWNEIKKHE